MASAAETVSALDTTVTVGNDEWFNAGTEGDFFNFGYSAGPGTGTQTDADAMGSISDNTYVDGTSTSRTVHHIYYAENTGGLNDTLDDSIYFGIVGASIPNTDDTFREIVYNGVTYTRASADVYDSSQGGNSTWQWNDVSPNGPTGGTVGFNVVL